MWKQRKKIFAFLETFALETFKISRSIRNWLICISKQTISVISLVYIVDSCQKSAVVRFSHNSRPDLLHICTSFCHSVMGLKGPALRKTLFLYFLRKRKNLIILKDISRGWRHSVAEKSYNFTLKKKRNKVNEKLKLQIKARAVYSLRPFYIVSNCETKALK